MTHTIQLHSDMPAQFIDDSRKLIRAMDTLHCTVHMLATCPKHFAKEGANLCEFKEDAALLDSALEHIQLFHNIAASKENGTTFAVASPLTGELHKVAHISARDFDALQGTFERLLGNTHDLPEIEQLRADFTTMRDGVLNANAQEHTQLFAKKIEDLHRGKGLSAA